MYDSDYISKKTDISVTIFDEIDSTNEEAKRKVSQGEDKDFALIARKQTAGKGRKGRSFYSPIDTGIYLTYVHFTDDLVKNSLKATVASGVIVKNAIKDTTGLECGIKWVNDLYFNGKKVCGILCECLLKGSCNNCKNVILVGIGINLTTTDFPDDILNKAGNITDAYELSGGYDIRNDISAEIINGLSEFFKDNYPFIDDYRKSSIVIGKIVELSDASGVFASGYVEDILDNGELLLVNDKGEKQIIDSGEISLIVVG